MSESIKVIRDPEDNNLFCVYENGSPYKCGLNEKDAVDLAEHLKHMEVQRLQAQNLSPRM